MAGRLARAVVPLDDPPGRRDEPLADLERLEHLGGGPEPEERMGGLVRPVQAKAEVDPAVGIGNVQVLRVARGTVADRVGQPAEALGADPDRDLDAWRLTLVRGARLGPVRAEVKGVRPDEPSLERVGVPDPRHAVGADLSLGGRDDVPDPSLEDEPEWLDDPGHEPLPAAIVDLDRGRLPDRVRHRGQVRCRLAGLEPAGCIEMEALDQP